MAQCATCVPRLYKSIIEEVIDNVRDKFLDEGIDEQVLIEVKQAWEQKVAATRATDHHDKHQGTSQQQQLQQTAHQQVASGLTGQPGQGSSAPAPPPLQSSIQTPVNLVPVQITVPAQQAGGTAKTITIHVPSTALANGVAGTQLQTILSAPSAAQTFAMEANQAAAVIQRQLNAALQRRGITLPPQLLQFGTQAQLDGSCEMPVLAPTRQSLLVCRCSTSSTSSTGARSKIRKQRKHLNALRSYCTTIPTAPITEEDGDGPLRRRADAGDCSTDSEKEDDVTTAQHLPTGATDEEARASRVLPIVTADGAVLDTLLLQRLSRMQVDGPIDDSSDEMSGDDDDDEEDKEEEDDKDKKFGDDEEDEEDAQDVNEDPLNSNDDVSDEETGEAPDPENVVVCQYDKITRVRNKWKFNLKDGIMNLKGKDYVFMKATGEGEW